MKITQAILDNVAETKVGTGFMVSEYEDVSIAVGTNATADLTVKFQGSDQENVNFGASKSQSNLWDYIQVIDKEDGSVVDGDTGIVIAAGAADVRRFSVNDTAHAIINAVVTAYTAGNITVKASGYNRNI